MRTCSCQLILLWNVGHHCAFLPAASGSGGAESCRELLGALKGHPELGGMVAEVFASLGKEGEGWKLQWLEEKGREGGREREDTAGMICDMFVAAAPFRDVAASSGVVPLICPLIASPSVETQLQALRAVANLCFDHGKQVGV